MMHTSTANHPTLIAVMSRSYLGALSKVVRRGVSDPYIHVSGELSGDREGSIELISSVGLEIGSFVASLV